MNIFHTILLNQRRGEPIPPEEPEPPDDNVYLTLAEDSVEISGAETRSGILAGNHNLYSPRGLWVDGITYHCYHGIYTDDGFGQGYLQVYDENNGLYRGCFRISNTEPIADSHTTPSFHIDDDGNLFMFQERTHGSPIDIYKGHINDFTLLAEKIGGVGATLGYMNVLKDADGNGISWCRFGTGSTRHQCVVQASNGFESWGDERRLTTSAAQPRGHYVQVPYYRQFHDGYWYVMTTERYDEEVTFQGWYVNYYVYRTQDFITFENIAGTPFSHDTSGDNYMTTTILNTNFRYWTTGDFERNGFIPIATVGPNGEFYCITGDDTHTSTLKLHIIIDRVITTKDLNIADYQIVDPTFTQAGVCKHIAAIDNYLEIAIVIDGDDLRMHLFRSYDLGDTWEDQGDMTPEATGDVQTVMFPMNYYDIPYNRNFALWFMANDTGNTRKFWVKRAAKGVIQSESPTSVTVPDSYSDAFNVFHYVAIDGQITKSGNNVTALTDQFGLRNATGTNNPQWNGIDAITTNGTNNYFTIPVSGQVREKFTLFAIVRGSGSSGSNILVFADNTSATRFLTFSVYDAVAGSAAITYRDDAGRNLKEMGQDPTNDDQWHAIAYVLDARCKVDIYIDGVKQYYENDGYTGGITDFAKRGKSNFGGTFNSIRIGSRDTPTTDIFTLVSFKRLLLKNTVYDYETFRGLYKKVADAHGITLNWGFQ